MTEEYRALLYPFGFLTQVAFGLRFLVQWMATEKAKKMITPKLFWHLSIAGNLLLLLHSLVQLHFPMSLAQSQNLVLSWRNLNLQGTKKAAFWFVVLMLAIAASSTVAFFACNSANTSWIATPGSATISSAVHLFGIIGIFCFGLRFWVQWWQAEGKQEGQLTESFWWISLSGALICTTYFFITKDWVNFIGPVLSLLPYSRNLYFIKRATT
jgi:lipid-A-disaccharide synthase